MIKRWLENLCTAGANIEIAAMAAAHGLQWFAERDDAAPPEPGPAALRRYRSADAPRRQTETLYIYRHMQTGAPRAQARLRLDVGIKTYSR